jgi:hypothetical protein
MARMRVVLQDVVCNDTEDVTGADEFYLAGAVSDGATNAGVMTRPIRINNGQTKPFGEGGGTVFDVDVPTDRIVKVVLIAFDGDSNKDWSKHGEVVSKIGENVSSGLASIQNNYTAAAGMILPFVIQAVGGIMSLDQDDELDQHLREFPVGSMPDGEHLQLWTFSQGGRWSSWNYTVRYQVIKG